METNTITIRPLDGGYLVTERYISTTREYAYSTLAELLNRVKLFCK